MGSCWTNAMLWTASFSVASISPGFASRMASPWVSPVISSGKPTRWAWKSPPRSGHSAGQGQPEGRAANSRVPPSAACWSQWRPEDRAANSQCPSEVRLLTAVKIHFRSFCLALGSVSFVRKAKIFLEFSSKGRAPNLSWVFWDWQSLCFLPLVTDTALASGWQLLDTGGEWTQG